MAGNRRRGSIWSPMSRFQREDRDQTRRGSTSGGGGPSQLSWMMGMLKMATTPSAHPQPTSSPSEIKPTPDVIMETESGGLRDAFTTFCCIFQDKSLRQVYGTYSRRTRREAALVLLSVSALLAARSLLLAALLFLPHRLPALLVSAAFLLINIAIFLVFCMKRGVINDRLLQVFTFYSWGVLAVQIILNIVFEKNHEDLVVTDFLEWSLWYVFLTFTVVPANVYVRFTLALVAMVTQLITAGSIAGSQHASGSFPANMIGANILLYLGALVSGYVTSQTLSDLVRQSFLQNRDAMAANLEMEQHSREQERLLLSVLPKHVADEMIKDMGNDVTSQFRKIYMNRHEHVSILFADIVGFTALSSIVTPHELVHILNDLFATFDKLANEYHQLRIKILGDCYYCISGCPAPRRDHAVLSIHMGLAMVNAIRALREKTGSGVNMRVGIHTGPVLGGVLGQVRWQYDVFGKEVTLANKMESGGLPGRVHISAATLANLNGEFTVEPGEGDTREDAIKEAGIQTYLIQSVIKPYPSGTLDEDKDSNRPRKKEKPTKRENRLETIHSAEAGLSGKRGAAEVAEGEAEAEGAGRSDREVAAEELNKALMEREDKVHMSERLHAVTMHFVDDKLERNYYHKSAVRQHIWPISASLTLITWFCFFSIMALQALNSAALISCVVGGTLFLVQTVILIIISHQEKRKRTFAWVEALFQTPSGHVVWAVVCGALLALSLLGVIFGCDSPIISAPYLSTNSTSEPDVTSVCSHPYYLACFCVLTTIGVVSLLHVQYLVRVGLASVVVVLYVLLYWGVLGGVSIETGVEGATDRALSLTLSSLTIFVSSGFVSRHMDRLCRKMYLSAEELEAAQGQIDALRTKNEQLIVNLLPEHVARDFIGTSKKDEELYSHAYEAVGVMFAACPNFNDFYTEDAVNHNGMECIRVLNEILSDYDDLMQQVRFQNITKIKTVGSTFMVASGMGGSGNNNSTSENQDTAKWQHLCDLVEFGFAMQDSLEKINQQSFNHFMLRIGLNHGAVLAGVIGARKPHYDIWGNTVNVASRMESTGQLGKLQVTEQTKDVLQMFLYTFEQRGYVKVKGKGELMTYFLLGRSKTADVLPNAVM